ncbi:metal/formaldehyde-sensitive transcriptional repressor [Acinetobacter larvae]|uniref:Transcriptional repressor RcnR to maintain nickel and cobalt homeostasis n=1 Tax=Acinetobacter larvae TaxID=1789224 RepID=A0A1B2M3P0_9GAMM|nr:metal/formaldehyde-sensitive transcriptional repressor [Acinetobacter larvae]AOA59789.1 transcriptional repressor RcnR to maintain nickel and cobalt homeostasis [Acinetobacter larvae]
MSHLHQNKKVLNRVRRLKGQLQAVENSMQQADNSCISVLQQVAAIKGAINGLMNELIEAHLREHVLPTEAAIDEEELQQFIKLLKRYA